MQGGDYKAMKTGNIQFASKMASDETIHEKHCQSRFSFINMKAISFGSPIEPMQLLLHLLKQFCML